MSNLVGRVFDEPAVPGGVYCAPFVTSQRVSGVAELLEPFDGPSVIWRRDAKLSRNVAMSQLRIPCS